MLKKLVPLILCLLILTGCNAANQPQQPQEEPANNAVLREFEALVQREATAEEVAGFIDEHIAGLSEADASKLVNGLEQIQQKELPLLESAYFEDAIQEKLNGAYSTIVAGNEPQDQELKALLARTKNGGYKIETAEGTYFPIIDYSFYKKYRDYVAPDLKAYIDIMAVESEQVPAKDAALVITWDEVVQRALKQEQFINTYKDSSKAAAISELYEKYVLFTLYGLNNTPLFDYNSKTIKPDAREAYAKAIADTGSSEYLKMLREYMDVLNNNGYKLTDEVAAYRNNIVKSLE